MGSKTFFARSMVMFSLVTKVLPFSLPVNLDPLGIVFGSSGSSLWTIIRPPALVTSPLSFS